MDAGILPEAIDVLTARPLDVDGTIQTGDWVADICMISASGLPNTINPKGSLVTDNLFTSDLAKRDVIDRDGFLDDVAAARSISDEEAYKLYEQFLAASVLAAETGAIVDEMSGGKSRTPRSAWSYRCSSWAIRKDRAFPNAVRPVRRSVTLHRAEVGNKSD